MVKFVKYSTPLMVVIPELQFNRVLWENLGLKLTPQQQQTLAAKYDVKNNGHMNYRMFCDVINQPFQADDMINDPRAQEKEAKEL